LSYESDPGEPESLVGRMVEAADLMGIEVAI
jgi:hypothetical protein